MASGTITPNPANYGNVSQNFPTTMIFIAQLGSFPGLTEEISGVSTSDASLDITDLTQNGFNAVLTESTLGAYSATITVTIQYSYYFANPGGSGQGGYYTGTYEIIIPVTATVIVPSNLSINPAAANFPNTQTDRVSTLEIQATNTGATAIHGVGIALVTGTVFTIKSVSPPLPFVINPGETVTITLQYSPTAFENDTDTLNITSDDGGDYSVPVTGTGVLLVPFASLVTITEKILMGFVFTNIPGLYEMDYSNLNGGYTSTLTLAGVLWNDPVNEKEMTRLQIRYEDLGPAELLVNSTVQRMINGVVVTDTKNASVSLGTTAATGKRLTAYADLIQAGQDVEITLIRGAAGGPISILDLTPYFEKKGEKVEDT